MHAEEMETNDVSFHLFSLFHHLKVYSVNNSLQFDTFFKNCHSAFMLLLLGVLAFSWCVNDVAGMFCGLFCLLRSIELGLFSL